MGEVLEVDFTSGGSVCMSKFFKGEGGAKGGGSLLSGFFLDRNTQLNLWIRFKYERIANFVSNVEGWVI